MSHDATQQDDWPSLDIVYEELRGRFAAQDAQIGALDSKANFGLGSATILTTAIVALREALSEPGIPASVTAERAVDVVTAVSVLAYVAVIGTSFAAYRVTTYKITPNPERLVEHWVYQPRTETRAALTRSRAEDLKENQVKIEEKACWTKWSLRALLAEAVLLLVITVVSFAL